MINISVDQDIPLPRREGYIMTRDEWDSTNLPNGASALMKREAKTILQRLVLLDLVHRHALSLVERTYLSYRAWKHQCQCPMPGDLGASENSGVPRRTNWAMIVRFPR